MNFLDIKQGSLNWQTETKT